MASLKTTYKNYLNRKIRLETWQKVGIFCLMATFSGLFGWIYEFIFYFFNGGMTEFFLQGGNFLPWINIYAIGACLVWLLVGKLKILKRPILVFLVSAVATGVLEYAAGWLIFKIGNGTRFWDYNVEIWNFGNVDGFICLRSVLVFGVSSMLLIYGILPILIHLSKIIPKKVFLTVAILIFSFFLVDEIYNSILTRLFSFPSAVEFYKSLGFKYVE